MKVLFVVAQLGFGGQEKQLTYLLSSVDPIVVQASVFVWNLNESEVYFQRIEKMGIPIFGANSNESSFIKLRKIRKYVISNDFDIVQGYSFYLNFAVWISTIGTKARAIGALRSSLTASIKTDGIFAGNLNAILPRNMIANSFSGAQEVISRYSWFKKNNVAVIPNALDIALFKFTKRENTIPYITVSTGSIIPVKRIDILVSVIYSLRMSGLDIRHYHAGTGSEYNKVSRIIEEYNLQDDFILVGDLHDIREHLSKAHVFVHSSEVEGMPNVIMEAMASGLPVVSTDCGDTRYMINDGISGYVVPIGNVKMLIERVEFLLKNYDCRINMGVNARQFAEEKFALTTLFEKNYSLYLKISNRDLRAKR
jgi:glycosyltransferase involved in cell wall biosynthesis